MRFHFFVATAALFCCGSPVCAVAQERFHRVAPSPAARLISIQVDSEESPFDLEYGDEQTQVDPQAQPDPQSLSSRQDPQGPSPVDSILNNSRQDEQTKTPVSTSSTPPATVMDGSHFAPLCWSQASYSHNALADYMRIQWCADGLWDTFPAERAAQCAKQWELISGAHRHRCGHCGHAGVHAYSGHCGHCAGGQLDCDTCDGNASPSRPINRYRLHRRHQTAGCCSQAVGDSACGSAECGSGECGNNSGCSSCDSNSPTMFIGRDLPKPTESQPASTPTFENGKTDRVAFLPLLGNR